MIFTPMMAVAVMPRILISFDIESLKFHNIKSKSGYSSSVNYVQVS